MEKQKRDRRVQYFIASCVSLSSVAMGCFSSWPTPVMPKIRDNETDIVISDADMAWMVSMSSPGFMTGSLVARVTADKFGRRATVLASFVPAALGTVVVACATHNWLLYLTRFLWGVGNAMTGTVVGIYLAEIADKEIRGSLSLITRFMFNFGNLLMMTIGPFVSYSTLNYMLLVLPVMYLVACWWVPETPYYYLKEGEVEAAGKVLRKIRRYKDEMLFEEELHQMRTDVKNEMRHSDTAKELFTGKQYRTAVFIAFGLKVTQVMSGQLIIQQYLGLIMKESGTNMALPTVLIIFGAVRFTVGVMSSVLADRVGRRPLLIGSYLGTATSLLIVGTYFFCLEVIQIDHTSLRPYGFITFAAIIAANVISTLGFNSIIGVVLSEIFPLNVKAVAIMSISLFGGFINFFTARGYQIVKDALGLYGAFWIFAGICSTGSVISYMLVPETKGKSLREIQMQLQGDMYDAGDVSERLNKDSNKENDSKELKEFLKKDNV